MPWAYGDRMRRHDIDLQGLVDYWIDRMETLLRACVRDRELIPAARSLDIRFHELSGNEMGILQKLYEYNGTELPPEGVISGISGRQSLGKHGRMVYDLQTRLRPLAR